MIADYLTETITIVQPAAKDEFGEPTGAALEISCPARVEWGTKVIRNSSGIEQGSLAKVFMLTAPSPGVDQLRIDGAPYPVVTVREKKSWEFSHWEVYIG